MTDTHSHPDPETSWPDPEATLRALKLSGCRADAERAAELGRAAQRRGQMDWAVRYLLEASRLVSLDAQHERALVFLQRAAALARRHRLVAEQAAAELAWGRCLSCCAQHRKAFRVLVNLLRSRAGQQHLTVPERANAFTMLAGIAAEIDPDAEIRCLQAGAALCRQAGQPLPRSLVASEAQAWLRRWVFTAPCFAVRLPPQHLPPPQREGCLARAVQLAGELPALTDPAVPLHRGLTSVTTAVVHAAAQGAASRLLPAADELAAGELFPRGYVYWMLGFMQGVALALDDLAVAQALHERLVPMDAWGERLRDLRIARLLLESVLLQRQGRAAQAAEVYRRYAVAWSGWSRAMELQPSELLSGVATAVDTQGADAPALAAPAWLERAQALVRTAGLQPPTVEQLAAAVGVSARTLRAAFKHWLDTPPLRYIEAARLDALRALLDAGALPGRTLTELATVAGYSHPSRLARAYAARFGERLQPSRRGPGLPLRPDPGTAMA